MSLIHTCELNGVNPFDYLTELQRHALNSPRIRRSECRGTFATQWQSSQHPLRHNTKVRRWPETILFGHTKMPIKHARKTHFETSKIQQGFWPATQSGENVSRWSLCARSTLDQQTLPMQMRALRDYATKRGWTIAVQVKEVGSGAVDASCVSN